MREPRNDKRSKPTKEPNAHYWPNMLSKHIKTILSFIILLICICFLCSKELVDYQFEAIKAIAWMSAGFLFGSETSK